MTEYTAKQGDTYGTIARLFYNDEGAAPPLARFNGASEWTTPPAENAKVKIPPLLYGIASTERQGEQLTVSLGRYALQDPKDAGLLVYSPALGKYLSIPESATDALSKLKDEATATADLAQKIADMWQSADPAALLDKARDMAEEVKSFFTNLSSAPQKAIDELLLVRKIPDLQDLNPRLFARPDILDSIASAGGAWKDAADKELGSALQRLQALGEEAGMVKSTIENLCASQAAWPWRWSYVDVAQAAESQINALGADARSRFMRFVAGTGLTDKLGDVVKKVQFNKRGSLDFSLINGSISGSWCLPDETGLNLFEILKTKAAGSSRPECFVRFGVTMQAHLMAEGDLAGAVSLPNLNLDGKKTSAQGAGSGSGSLGGSGGGAVHAEVAWARKAGAEYRQLARVDLTAQGGGSLKGRQDLSIGYHDQAVQIMVPARYVKGLSGDGAVGCDVVGEEGIALITHLFLAILDHYFAAVARDADGLRQLALHRFEETRKAMEQKAGTVAKRVNAVAKWLSEARIVNGSASGAWYFPEENGFDALRIFRKVPLLSEVLKPGVECWFRFKLALSAYAFGEERARGSSSGATAASSLSAAASGNVAAAAGGKGSLVAALEWRADQEEDFRTLGQVVGSVKIDLKSALSLSAATAMGYRNGTLQGVLPLSAIPGFGLTSNAALVFVASGDEAKKLVNHLFTSVDLPMPDIPGLGDLGVADVAGAASKLKI